jgi:hypothetical protein
MPLSTAIIHTAKNEGQGITSKVDALPFIFEVWITW